MKTIRSITLALVAGAVMTGADPARAQTDIGQVLAQMLQTTVCRHQSSALCDMQRMLNQGDRTHARTGRNAIRVLDAVNLDSGKNHIVLASVQGPQRNDTCVNSAGVRWRCGRQAARALENLIASRQLKCTRHGRTWDARILATCRVGHTEVNRWMVENGWARAGTDAGPAYHTSEWRARMHERGIWSEGSERRVITWE